MDDTAKQIIYGTDIKMIRLQVEAMAETMLSSDKVKQILDLGLGKELYLLYDACCAFIADYEEGMRNAI